MCCGGLKCTFYLFLWFKVTDPLCKLIVWLNAVVLSLWSMSMVSQRPELFEDYHKSCE